MNIFDIIYESVAGVNDSKAKKYFSDASDLLSSHFGISQELIITFSPPYDLDKSQNGACIAFSEKPGKIYIFIDGKGGLANNELLLALCHEFVHASQFSRGDLVFTSFSGGKFNGRWMDDGIVNGGYSRSNPWEVEAHKDERQLMSKVIGKLGNLL